MSLKQFQDIQFNDENYKIHIGQYNENHYFRKTQNYFHQLQVIAKGKLMSNQEQYLEVNTERQEQYYRVIYKSKYLKFFLEIFMKNLYLKNEKKYSECSVSSKIHEYKMNFSCDQQMGGGCLVLVEPVLSDHRGFVMCTLQRTIISCVRT